MAKYFENITVFNFRWEQVAQGFWKKYPNPQSGHVLTEDTLAREIRDGRLHSKRFLTKTNRVPKWGERFFNAKSVKILEESIVDPKTKTLITYTCNMGYAKVMSVVEKVVYRAADGNPEQTIAVRTAWIDSQVYGFSSAIRAFGVERFKANCHKMVGGFNHVLHTMFPHQNQLSHEGFNFNTSSNMKTTAKIKEVAKTASDMAKAHADQIYQTYSVRS